MTSVVLSLIADDVSATSLNKMFKALKGYLAKYPAWDVTVNGSLFMKGAHLRKILRNYRATIGVAKVNLLRLEFFNPENFIVGGLALHVDWGTLQHVTFVEEYGEDSKIILQIGIDDQIILSSPTI